MAQSHAKTALPFDKDDPADEGDLDANTSVVASTGILRALTKYVTSKHTDDASIKELIQAKIHKDRIFENIFEQFAKG